MTKKQFVAVAASEFSLTKKLAEAFLDYALAEMGAAVVKTGRFEWPKFGVWTLRSRKARRIVNPQTGDDINLPKMWTVGFRPAKELKATIPAKRKGRAA
jgi:DNA-binding protein HU-beta